MTLIAVIQSYKYGDQRSAKDLYLLIHPWLFALALRYIRDENSTKDVLQNTYEKIFKNIDNIKLDSEDNIRSWMKSVCINEALMLIRKNKKWDKLQRKKFKEVYIPVYEFENQRLLKLLNYLPEQQRLCFNLYAIEGYSHQEISALLEIKESYSRTLVSRARKLLATKLPKDKINEAS